MSVYKINGNQLDGLLETMGRQRDVYVLTDRSQPIKDFFFPPAENMMRFQREGQQIKMQTAEVADKPFVIFGARACDARSLTILDSVFLHEPVDSFYQKRQEVGIVITMACTQPEETCFCGAFGIDGADPEGDVSCFMQEDTLYWQPKTDKGQKLTEELKGLLEPVTDDRELQAKREEVRSLLQRLPFAQLDLSGFDGAHWREKFESPKWEELSKACIGCGTCTFVCPTCQCYDIRDRKEGDEVVRYRCWDSCMYSDFTLMAHGNSRKTQKERFRQRFMHKLIYYPAEHEGVYSCVGCGRCLAKCPISMNIVKVAKALGGK